MALTTCPKILVWGGATTLGMYVIQLAKLSGYNVVTTASTTNHGFLKSLGALATYDYREEGVSKLIKEYTKDNLTFAVDCISEGSTPVQVAESMSSLKGGVVSVVLPVDKDTFGLPDNITIQHYLVYDLLGKVCLFPYRTLHCC